MKKRNDEIVVESGGSIYADLGRPNAEERKAKVRLMHMVAEEIERQGLSQNEAAKRVGVMQSDISNMTRGRGRTYSMERLFEVFHNLGGRVTIIAEVGSIKERIPVFTRT